MHVEPLFWILQLVQFLLILPRLNIFLRAISKILFFKTSLYLIWEEFSEGTMLEKKSAEEEKCRHPGFSRDRQVLCPSPAVHPDAQIVCTHSLTVEGCSGLGLLVYFLRLALVKCL